MSFQISLIGITGTFLANIINVALPKVREQFVSENPFKNKMIVHMGTPKFFVAYASMYIKI